MAGRTSKTARASSPSMNKGGFQIAADVDRIVSLNGGKFAYVRDAAGKTTHFNTASDAFVAKLVTIDAERIDRELTGLCATYPSAEWDKVAARVADARAAAAAEAENAEAAA